MRQKNLFEYEKCYLKILTGDKFHFSTQFSPLVELKMKINVSVFEQLCIFINHHLIFFRNVF